MIYISPKIAGIILAAGKAERMDKVKQLLSFRETTILGQVVKNALGSSLYEVIVVLGHAAEEIRPVIDLGGTRIVINADYTDGQSTSLKAGLSAISEESEAALFILGDQPLIGANIINAILDKYSQAPASIVIPTYNGKRGNPVLIDRALFPRIVSLQGDVGARILFDEYSSQLHEIEMGDEYLTLDVDTLDDYARLLEIEKIPKIDTAS
jgi:molybdenum cofactor cytidylyltransferase